MPNLSDLQESNLVKMILLGDAGSGKTGALTSLVKAGYKIRVLDFDNNLAPLAKFIKHECPDKIDNVEFRTLIDKYKSSPIGAVLDGMPSAFVDGVKMLDRWKYKTVDGRDIDLGPPSEWGPECILVIDSLTFLSNYAYNWADSMNPSAKDKRQIYFVAQSAVEDMLALMKSPTFNTNIIVTAHIRYEQRQDGTVKGFPNSVGSALGPQIPAYFTSIALMETTGAGSSINRQIRTVPTALIDLRNPAPFAMAPALPISTGLADFFRTVKG